MTEDAGRYPCIAALLITGLLGMWTAWACRRAQRHGLPGGDAAVWAWLAAVFLFLSATKLARVLGLLKGLGQWLRVLVREQGLYANRRLQVVATVAVALTVVVLLVIGIVSLWDYVQRCRLAIGFASLAVGLGAIRLISLREVDTWNTAMPWLRVVAELIAAAGASTLAVVRLRQLARLTRTG